MIQSGLEPGQRRRHHTDRAQQVGFEGLAPYRHNACRAPVMRRMATRAMRSLFDLVTR
ncbi:hypothetical protein [Pseudomonas mosselii]|uniref:hypothetical protein n=1 Tax=Pseudomonas mosselii TaxID=78327 RepID=UPI00142E9182|nr:hypothetical protein [Pseudomonas mosselii]UVN47082.1 hypothetical protein NW905_14315 [Pseudomonas mosselii]